MSLSNIEAIAVQMKESSGFTKLAESTHIKWFGDSGNLVIGSEFPGGPGQVTISAQDVPALRDILALVCPAPVFQEPEVESDTKKRK